IVLEETFAKAKLDWEMIDAIAVTQGPGLVGALLVGVNTAKGLAFAKQKPLVGVHHIAGPIYANRLIQEFAFPLLALVVSGGHTELIVMKSHTDYEGSGETQDESAGQAYEKVARVLDLPYPGGPQIDRLAAVGEETIAFPRAWLEADSFDFSFSGLKSSVINTIHNAKQRGEQLKKADIAASFQASVVDVLTEKTFRAAQQFNVQQVIVSGGVAANKGLRKRMQTSFQGTVISLLIPLLDLCTDNAAMIAAAGTVAFEQGKRAGWDLNAHPSLLLS